MVFQDLSRYISLESPFLNFEPKLSGWLVRRSVSAHIFFVSAHPLMLVYQKHQRVGAGETIEPLIFNFEPKLSGSLVHCWRILVQEFFSFLHFFFILYIRRIAWGSDEMVELPRSNFELKLSGSLVLITFLLVH